MLFSQLKNSFAAKFKRSSQALYSTKEEYYDGRIRLPLLHSWLTEKRASSIAFHPVLLFPDKTDFDHVSLSGVKKKLAVTYKKVVKPAQDELQVWFVKNKILEEKCIVQLQFQNEQPVYISYEISGFSKTELVSVQALPKVLELFLSANNAAQVARELTNSQDGIFRAVHGNWLMVIQFEFKLIIHYISLDDNYRNLLQQAADALSLPR